MKSEPAPISNGQKTTIQIKDTDITLKEAGLHDAPAIYRAIDENRDYLKTWLPFVVNLQSVADEEKFLSSLSALPYEERNIVFMIEQAGELCGLIGFVNTDTANHKTEIGYWLLPRHQGKGVMTQCVKELCLWAAEKRQMNRIQIKCAVGNQPSNAIPQRLNFKFEGIERDGELLSSGLYTDINIYSILKCEISFRH